MCYIYNGYILILHISTIIEDLPPLFVQILNYFVKLKSYYGRKFNTLKYLRLFIKFLNKKFLYFLILYHLAR